MTTLTFPFPVSANRYWRRGRNGAIYVSQAADEYKLLIGWQCRSAGIEPIDGPVRITVEAYMPSKNRDLGNTAKVLEDSLRGHMYIDDLQIVEQHYYRKEAKRPKKKCACVVVTVESVS
jgi:crossover junction endodeoxyribonuclease RusA